MVPRSDRHKGKATYKKEECAICGGEIGLLGNRKLEDGNCCKNCAAKLSPWFSDRRQSTVEEIKEQLAYREANQEKVAAFRVTRTLGEGQPGCTVFLRCDWLQAGH